MLRDIDVKRLKLFKQVAECGGLSAAEKALNINLPTISAHLASLEESIGFKLCDRGRKGFRLTKEGQSVLDSCNKLFESLEQFQSELSVVTQMISGSLKIGIVDNIITDKHCLLVPVIHALKSQSKDLEINLEIRNPSELERLLLEERIDIAIGPFHITNPGIDQIPLYKEQVSLYISDQHPLFAKKTLQLDDLVGAEYVTRGYLRESQVTQQHVSFNFSATAQSIEGIALLILSGKYIGYLPDHYASSWVQKKQMRNVLPSYFTYEVGSKGITLKNKSRTKALLTLLKLLEEFHPAKNY
jgi:LysR family transcriptional regulator, transcriptional activator for bauABCD operon